MVRVVLLLLPTSGAWAGAGLLLAGWVHVVVLEVAVAEAISTAVVVFVDDIGAGVLHGGSERL